MKTTNRLISLFAALLTTATLMAGVVYEPLIVDSGFNRDVIAENSAISGYATTPIYDGGATSCFATTSVIAAINGTAPKSYIKTEEDYNITVESGWSDDYRDTIRCILDAKDDPLYKDAIFLLAPYNQNNALTLRPDNTIGGEGTLKFKKVGCYNKMFFLTASLKQGDPGKPRQVSAIVYYTDGTNTKDTFYLATGLGGQEGHKVRTTNIYESTGYFIKNTSYYTVPGQGKACVSIFDIDLDETKLVDRVEFKNEVDRSAAIIFAVTGRTADIDAPADEATQVSDIDKNSFQACWEAVTNAVSYRLDVATDSAFQHILEAYNNKVIDDGICAEVKDLVEDSAYYWRIRSVNEDGGQSASSTPMRVRTASSTPPETSETSEDIESMLAAYTGYRYIVPEITIHRTLCRNGYFNTLCLPFNMNADQIAASPIAGVRVFEYIRAEKTTSGLDIEINGPIDHIDAGVPYLVNWEPTSPEWIGADGLVFNNVNIVTYKGDTIGADDEVQFIGNIGIASLVELDHNNLFLGAENTLYYPEGDTRLRGFRSYFKLPVTVSAGAPPARIVMRQQAPTDIEDVQGDKVQCTKVIRDGQIYLMYEGAMYDMFGRKIATKP